MKPSLNQHGYPQVLLYKNRKHHTQRVHRLIAEVFLKDYYDKPQVNHIDGNKTNNAVTNLEMVTNSENQLHAYKNKLEKPAKQSRVEQYDLDGNYLQTFEYVRDAGKQFGIDESSIIKCCRNKRKTAGNYMWRYVEGAKSR